MNIKLKVSIFLVVIFLFLYLIHSLKKDKIPVKYSVIWFFSGLVLLIVALFPNFMTSIAKILGFKILSNMLLFLLVGLLIMITMSLTIIVSSQKKQIKNLTQEISLLKSEVKK